MTDGGSARGSRPRVMPPLAYWPGPGDGFLREAESLEFGAEFWLQLRHLWDWLARDAQSQPAALFHTPPSPRVLERRAAALLSARDLPRVATALERFHALTDGHPVTALEIASACVEVADWALGCGLGETAMQFSAAAARAEPLAPHTLNAAGLMHRRAGERVAAELYYQRAAYCARQQHDVDELIGANIGMAALWSSRGHTRRARRHLDRATDIAQRSGSAWLAAHAQHDLMLMLTERGEFVQAEAAASRAIALYPLSDARLPFFAADFAFLLISRGFHTEAIAALEQFLLLVTEPAQQVIGLSLLARAYAGAGSSTEFERVRDRVTGLTKEYEQDAAAAYFHLAEAARLRGEWNEAARLAELSARIAGARGDRAVERFAEALSAAVRERRLPRQEGSHVRRVTAGSVVARLRRWNPNRGRGRKRRPRRNHWGGF